MKQKVIILLLLLGSSITCCLQAQEKAVSPDGMIKHPWAGMRVGYIGDSITDPNLYNGSIKNYWKWLEEWLGITPYVYGISGRQWNDVPNQGGRLLKEHGQEVDAILVFLGTNDFNASIPIGNWYTETKEMVMAARGKPKQEVLRTKRSFLYTDSTYKGRINIGLRWLKQHFPDKQIILLTPLHRSTAIFGDTNVQPDENYQNACGEYIDAYVEAIREAGNLWGVPVIDFNAVSGINPMVEEQLIYLRDTETDRLHPSNKGHERMARTLLYQLLAYPARF
ncbi:SGNH/GDSL hydrolase family protein [Parabacteroides sp. OttesenSCG-928-O15]|nr:SGNH/GDSL hydrolase family protein [Parabacteroides sp. OttesenSCG-928-O15]